MSSIVIDLQDEILSSDCDIVQILRRAHVIAVKLGLKEFDQWISYELNGYPDQNACPDYRKVRGTLKAFNPYHGWIPAVITDGELETVICEKKISNSISEIITLSKNPESRLVYEFPGDQVEHLDRLFGSPLPMRYALHISTASVMDIIEKVKNTQNNIRFILPPFYDLYSIGFVSLMTWAVDTNITIAAILSIICPTTVCISVWYQSLFKKYKRGMLPTTSATIVINSFLGSMTIYSNSAFTIRMSDSLVTMGVSVVFSDLS